MSVVLVPLVLGYVGNVNCFLLDTIANHIPHQVCYGDLGCFSNGAPFLSLKRPLSVVPESPDEIGTRFLLYTRRNPTVAQEQLLETSDESSVTTSYFNGSLSTKIIVHGFTHNGHRPWIVNLTRELLTVDDMNVIVADWQNGASIPYEQATANTRVVGAQIAQLVNMLSSMTGADNRSFHIIGHSLGAHTAGYAGERVSHLGRISALDPASPYFENTDAVVHLDPTDADFVDVIHTDGGGLKNLGFGATQAMGHVDFYPNGGERQPGCPADAVDKLGATTWTALTTLFDYYAEEEAIACSHERSYYYFMESINSPCPFLAWNCADETEFHEGHCVSCMGDTCSRMGYFADQYTARGTFFLETASIESYCEYNYQLKINSTNNFDGKLTLTLEGTNGVLGPMALMTNNEAYFGNSSITKTFRSPVNIGEPLHLTIGYEKMSVPVISNSFPDDWHMAGISLWRADWQKWSTFCGDQETVYNHNSTTFGVEGIAC